MKRLLFGVAGGAAGVLAGTVLAATLFVLGVGLMAAGGAPGPHVGGLFLPLLAAVGAPCAAGGALLFAFPPTRFGSLLIRLGLSTAGAALYGVGWVVAFDASESRNAVAAVVAMAAFLSIPLWLLAVASLGVGAVFFRPAPWP